MDDLERRSHWENVYGTKTEEEVSWFEERPAVSLELIHATGEAKDAAIIDIGGGASRLVDALLQEGYSDVTVLDLSERALAVAQARLGDRAARVTWITADVTGWKPAATFDVWHDRAAFHFLTEPEERSAYVARVLQALRVGGHLIIGTFAVDGPERCSGLPVQRHGAASLADLLGPVFALAETRSHRHLTPMGRVQRFQFSRFHRTF
jgi:SAM-dependent methyltransferase